MRAWGAGVLLVAGAYIATLAGTWLVTDHGEMLYMSRRILHERRFDLADAGETPNRFVALGRGRESGVVRSRFVPVTSLWLVPLLALDEALGLGHPERFGRIVHAQGALFVLAGLLVIGRGLQHSGASPAATTLAVTLAGLAWPAWMIARRLGPEPILFFLVAVFVACRGVIARALVQLLLPWTHVTGVPLGVALLGAATIEAAGAPEPARAARRLVPLLLAAGAGVASVVLIWNRAYQGNWWGGGYAAYGADPFFDSRGFLAGLGSYLPAFLLQAALPLLVAVAGARGRALAGTPGLPAAVCTTLALLALFSFFSTPEPPRRLSPALAAWGLAAGAAWDRLGWSGRAARGLVTAALALGLLWLASEQTGLYAWSFGQFFLPEIRWLRWAAEGRPAWLVLLPPAAGGALFLTGARYAWRALGTPPRAQAPVWPE